MKENSSNIPGMALGILLGIAIGIAQDNPGLWISLGLAIGVAIDYTRKQELNQNLDSKNKNSE